MPPRLSSGTVWWRCSGKLRVAGVSRDDLASSRPCPWERARVPAVGEAIAIEVGLSESAARFEPSRTHLPDCFRNRRTTTCLPARAGETRPRTATRCLAARTLTTALVFVSSFTIVPVAWPVEIAALDDGLSRFRNNVSLCSRAPSPWIVTSIVPTVRPAPNARFLRRRRSPRHPRSRRSWRSRRPPRSWFRQFASRRRSGSCSSDPRASRPPSHRGSRTPAGSDRCRRSSRRRSRCQASR